jgi:predicted kinase
VNTKLVFIGGQAGTGKTHVAHALIAQLNGYCLVDKDTCSRLFTERLLEILPHADLPDAHTAKDAASRESAAYLRYVRDVEYASMLEVAFENLHAGLNVLAVAPFARELGDEAWISSLEDRLATLDAQLAIIWIYCKPALARMRIERRAAARDHYKLEHWDEYLAATDYHPAINRPHFTLATDFEPLPLTPLLAYLQELTP